MKVLSIEKLQLNNADLGDEGAKAIAEMLKENSSLQMAPTKEEESKLKEFQDESPFKLGLAEKFLKVVLGIPFAFKKVDAMLYIANFDSELEYLKNPFETLEIDLSVSKELNMHHVGFVDTEDMNLTSGKRKFSSMVGYSSSKLAEARKDVESVGYYIDAG
ncbi:Formin-like protein 1 [Glycine soja]|uniref:Formin-like protein 1 n=1 Tax=Glycine soja TaxID=3848 RepID=A0A445GVH6_GLYSO|nr:Formin-like protein 1 [Glycine soja]